jgi:hypothetical protein
MNHNAYIDLLLERDLDEEIKAYHGSPHKFEVFSTDAMGSGEGVQEFGWGLYFTDSKEIAEFYAKAGESAVIIDKKSLAQRKRFQRLSDEDKANVELLLRDMADGTLTKSQLFGYAAQLRGSYLLAYNFIRDAKEVKYAKPNIYRVTLHKGKSPDQYHYLNWYESVSESDINRIVGKLPAGKLDDYNDKIFDYSGDGDVTGESIYKTVSDILGSDKAASQMLLKSGVDGIKYPAGTISGFKKSKATNYVVFDPKAVTIEKEPV